MLKHRCTIRRNTKSIVNAQVQQSWTDHLTGVWCKLEENAGRIARNEAGQGLEYDARLFLSPGADVRPQNPDDQSDQIVMTRPAKAATYLVIFVGDDTGEARVLTAYLKRVPSAT